MDDARREEVLALAARLQLAAAGRQYVSDPVRIGTVGERDGIAFRLGKDVYRGTEGAPGAATVMLNQAETRHAADE